MRTRQRTSNHHPIGLSITVSLIHRSWRTIFRLSLIPYVIRVFVFIFVEGILTLADLNNYRPIVEKALHSRLHDNSSVYGVPPPSGGLILQYIMNIMDGYGYNNTWDTMNDDDKILFYQRFTEAMKFAYARRTELGDEDFVPEVTEVCSVK